MTRLLLKHQTRGDYYDLGDEPSLWVSFFEKLGSQGFRITDWKILAAGMRLGLSSAAMHDNYIDILNVCEDISDWSEGESLIVVRDDRAFDVTGSRYKPGEWL